ncbi:MAG: hypothetical protein VCF07_01655 [Nitrospinota bacterium]
MEPGKETSPGENTFPGELSEREKGFLSRLAQKYETGESAGIVRSYLIAGLGVLALFALARWTPQWWAALIVVEAAAPALFRQYKRFGSFKTHILVKLWRERTGEPG